MLQNRSVKTYVFHLARRSYWKGLLITLMTMLLFSFWPQLSLLVASCSSSKFSWLSQQCSELSYKALRMQRESTSLSQFFQQSLPAEWLLHIAQCLPLRTKRNGIQVALHRFQVFGCYLFLRVASHSRMSQPNESLQTYLQAVIKKEQGDLLPSVTEVVPKCNRFQALN